MKLEEKQQEIQKMNNGYQQQQLDIKQFQNRVNNLSTDLEN